MSTLEKFLAEQQRERELALERRHEDARRNPPPYAVRAALRAATLKEGRDE